MKEPGSLRHSAETPESDVRKQTDANKTLSNLVENLWEKEENKGLTQRTRVRFESHKA